ncbi:MAG: glycosyltransferase family 4 protein [Verrucomicrobia bacterium]|nr:glycosyltransferase family 4 protein [Verrucomicrobiota bacterium]
MKACIDIQSTITQRAGVGRYTKSLVEQLAATRGHDELELFYFDFKRKGAPYNVDGAEQRAIRWCPGRIVQKSWKTVGFPPFNWFSGSADVYHFPNFIRPPLTSGRSVVTIHDVAFLRFPEMIEEKNLRYLTAQIRKTAAKADAIITVSQFTANEVRELLDVDIGRITAIHSGLSANMTPPSADHIQFVRHKYGLDSPYLLTVGTLEPRKNIPFLIDVFERLEGFDGELVIAGMYGWKYDPIVARMQNAAKARKIRHLDFVDDDDLPSLYAGAELFVFPSTYEGFGFPPLESMACGTPAVAGKASSLPEILESAAVLIDEFDADSWAVRIKNLLESPSEITTLKAEGFAHARGFTWEAAARKTWEVYRSLSRT